MSGDAVLYAAAVVAPAALVTTSWWFFRHRVRGKKRVGTVTLLVGNALVLLVLLSLGFLGLESYYRFVCDTTDGDAQTKLSRRWFARHWQTNSLGLRDDVDYRFALNGEARRVTFLGDSFTAGHGVELHNRFANRIRERRPDWEVHAIADLGDSTITSLHRMNALVRAGYELDTVVLVYVFNDIEPFVPEMQEVFALYARPPAAALAPIVDHSYFANALYYYWKAWRAGFAAGPSYWERIERAYSGPAWEQETAVLDAFRRSVKTAGGRLLVVTFPMLTNLGRGESEDHVMHEKLDELWRSMGVPHLDLLGVLDEHKGRNIVVGRFDDHPSAYAHGLTAEAILSFIEKEDPR